MPVDPKEVNRLRQETGAGMMDCKRALEEAGGDFNKAREIIRKKGLEKADMIAAKGPREGPREGRIGVYLHTTGKGGAMVELTCDTDFVAKNEQFQELLRELAVAVFGFNPSAVSKEDLPKELVEEEKKKYEADIKGKPPQIAEKIIEGKLEKNLYSQRCLLHIPYPKEEKFKGTYGDFLKSKVAILKENIVVRRFHRMEVGG
jgi:elongation factor Ts